MLEKLYKKDEPKTLETGQVASIDTRNRRVQVTLPGATVRAAYDPSGFPDLAGGDSVLVGRSGGALYLVRKIPTASPGQVVLLHV
jgi:hypothetical protein